MKFFFSYSRSVKQEVFEVIELLRAPGHHEVWWDGDIPETAPWWATILDKIEWCDVFVFMVSEKSVQSAYCLTELEYAVSLNLPILPFVGLDDHNLYKMPEEIVRGHYQWFFYDKKPAETIKRIQNACTQINWDLHQRRAARRLPEPNTGSDSLIKRFQQAAALAEEGHFKRAKQQFREVQRDDRKTWGARCDRWLAQLELYEEVIEFSGSKWTLLDAREAWDRYLQTYGMDFDPLGLQSKLAATPTTTVLTPPTSISIAPTPAAPAIVKKRTVADILPLPFAWVEIPAGNVTLITDDGWRDNYIPKGKPQIFDVPAFSIAKYPVTNAQFKKFVDAKGYQNKTWWTDAGWEIREREKLTEPRYWNDSKWNGDDFPVVGVSWYESLAFCLWLKNITDENVMLPTEQQWQRAAQGDDGHTYPWGNDWDGKRCNNSVKPEDSNTTTPVKQYEGETKGDSPFGVTDMAGNVWEWCLTDYETGEKDINKVATYRVLRGGSWDNSNSMLFRVDSRDWGFPLSRGNGRGFRFACSL